MSTTASVHRTCRQCSAPVLLLQRSRAMWVILDPTPHPSGKWVPHGDFIVLADKDAAGYRFNEHALTCPKKKRCPPCEAKRGQ